MKLKKLKTPRDAYVATSRNGVRLSKSSQGPDAGNAEVAGVELDGEDLEVGYGLTEGLNPAEGTTDTIDISE